MKAFFKYGIVLSISSVIFVALSCNSGKTPPVNITATPGDTAKISFMEYEHDFGSVTEGEKVACVFKFENTGNAPLVIISATTSCGCTVSKYDTKPVAPGNSGTLEVVFDSSGRNGRQTKTITVTTNASKPVILLRITGEVVLNSKN